MVAEAPIGEALAFLPLRFAGRRICQPFEYGREGTPKHWLGLSGARDKSRSSPAFFGIALGLEFWRWRAPPHCCGACNCVRLGRIRWRCRLDGRHSPIAETATPRKALRRQR